MKQENGEIVILFSQVVCLNDNVNEPNFIYSLYCFVESLVLPVV